MIPNNNLFKIRKESDIYEIVNDNKEKSIFILFLEKLTKEEELIKICNNKDIIILIVIIDEYIPEGNININHLPDIIMFNKNNDNIREKIKKIIF